MTKFQYFFLFFSIFLHSCAVPGTLTGGTKDEKAPKIDSLHSSPNFVTNFEKKNIKLVFDEWIVLENPQAQVVVSPPLAEKPDIKLNGKTVEFAFSKNEVLRPDATYTINFGESIKDLHEGNKTNFRYVFSTGKTIDSLKVQAQVIDAFTREPVENVFFMLYDNFNDSVVVKERPFYFAKTDKTGFCTIENVKKGTFKAFALLDVNANFKFDLPTEKIGFISEKVDSQDSTKNKIHTLMLSDAPRKMQILEKSINSYGLAKFVFPQAAKDIQFINEDKGQKILRENDGDTLKIWYDNKTTEAWKMFILKDTVTIKSLSREDFLKKTKLLTNTGSSKRGKAVLSSLVAVVPNKLHEISWNFPITNLDESKILLLEDSTQQKLDFSIKIDSISARKTNFSAKWKEGKKYNLTILPDAFTDFFGHKNDTIKQQLFIGLKKDFGDLTVNYVNLDDKKQYLLQLLNESNTLIEERIINKSSKGKVIFSTISPLKYKVRVITDDNKNGKWDGSDYFGKTLAEDLFIKILDELKPNWELDTTIDLTNRDKVSKIGKRGF